MATTTQTITGALPSAFETYYTSGVEGQEGLIPQAFKLYGQATPEDFASRYVEPLKEAGLYGAGRVAGLSPEQQAVQQQLASMGTPAAFGAGAESISSGIAGLQGLTGLQAQTVSAPTVSDYSMAKPSDVTTQALRNFGMEAPEAVRTQTYTAPSMAAASTAYRPDLTYYQMAEPGEFGEAQAQRYMSPYVQQVLEVQKREALRDAQRAQLGANLSAAKQGTYGGARQLIAQTERERALGQQLGDIQARGLQSAFESAQQQFERDRAARMGAQQQNLAAQLGVQQLGVQTGLQTALANLTADQQARVQNQAAILQTQGLNAEQALRAALANQQAGLTVGQQNLAAQLGVQQLGSEQALRAALANQQAGLTVGQQNLAAQLQTQQLRAGQALEAQRANQAAALQAAQQQAAAAMGLGTLGAQMGQIGIGQQAADIDRLKTLGAFGDLTRGIEQQELDARYADLMRGITYPEQQLQNLSGFIRGIPLTDQIMTTTTPPPSFASQLAGMGLAGLSLYNLYK